MAQKIDSNMSGITVSPSVVQCFEQMKLRRTLSAMTLKFNDKTTEVVIDKEYPTGTNIDEVFGDIDRRDARYIIVDLHYKDEDGCDKERLTLILWSPDCAKTKSKFLYSTTKKSLTTALSGIHMEVQASLDDELNEASLIKRALNAK